MKEFEKLVNKKLDQARITEDLCIRKNVTIYRVPSSLRGRDESTYIPQLVSLGPYHHGDQRLAEMEQHKWRAVLHVFERCEMEMPCCITKMKRLERQARDCYEGFIGMKSNEFALMMVLDGLFLSEMLLGAVDGFVQRGYSEKDPIFSERGMLSIHQDVLMMENQIPVFVVEALLRMQLELEYDPNMFATAVVTYFNRFMPTNYSGVIGAPVENGPHCLGIFRHRMLNKYKFDGVQDNRGMVISHPLAPKQEMIHCASELIEAGVDFKRGEKRPFWDLTFDKGILEIPPLHIHYSTQCLFLNLIAYEQCHPECCREVTSYVFLLDNLINTEKDVACLHERGILEHWLGSDMEVANMFNGLCKELVFCHDSSYLGTLSTNVNKYCRLRWNRWIAGLKHIYYSSPGAIIAAAVAFSVFGMAFLQAFYSAYGYHHPKNS